MEANLACVKSCSLWTARFIHLLYMQKSKGDKNQCYMYNSVNGKFTSQEIRLSMLKTWSPYKDWQLLRIWILNMKRRKSCSYRPPFYQDIPKHLVKTKRLFVTRIREIVGFELSKEIEKDVFHLVVNMGQRKTFLVPMLYHWATETPWWARSITKYIWHASCILLGSAMLITTCL